MAATYREVQRVLYVDDDPVSRRIFEQVGKTAHVAVDSCGSLDEAFAFARQHAYSVIAADYSLRRWDGLSVLRELSGLQSNASLMLVTDPERKSELPSSLLKYVFVEKPIRRAEVLSQLSDAVSAYEERAASPQAILHSAPVLLLGRDDAAADHLARCIAEQGRGRLRVRRTTTVEQALLLLKSVKFSAAVLEGAPSDSTLSDALNELHVEAPNLPVVLLEPDEDANERASLALWPHVSTLKRNASPELVMHVLCGAVERAARRRQIAALSQTDLTSGALNRPTFCNLLARRTHRQGPFVLACVAIDDLSEINEALGQIRGDAVLAASVVRLARELASDASIGRLGGSVFGITVEAPTADTGARLVQTVKQVFELPFDLCDSHVRVGVRVSAVCFPEDGTEPEELLSKVERAMRLEKARTTERRRSSRPPPANSASSVASLDLPVDAQTATAGRLAPPR